MEPYGQLTLRAHVIQIHRFLVNESDRRAQPLTVGYVASTYEGARFKSPYERLYFYHNHTFNHRLY